MEWPLLLKYVAAPMLILGVMWSFVETRNHKKSFLVAALWNVGITAIMLLVLLPTIANLEVLTEILGLTSKTVIYFATGIAAVFVGAYSFILVKLGIK